jgi:hypothetical protein
MERVFEPHPDSDRIKLPGPYLSSKAWFWLRCVTDDEGKFDQIAKGVLDHMEHRARLEHQFPYMADKSLANTWTVSEFQDDAEIARHFRVHQARRRVVAGKYSDVATDESVRRWIRTGSGVLEIIVAHARERDPRQ